MFIVGDKVQVVKEGLLTSGLIGTVKEIGKVGTNPVKVSFPRLPKPVGFGLYSSSLKLLERTQPKKTEFGVGEKVEHILNKIHFYVVRQVGEWVRLKSCDSKTTIVSHVDHIDSVLFKQPKKDFHEMPVVEYKPMPQVIVEQHLKVGSYVKFTTREGRTGNGEVLGINKNGLFDVLVLGGNGLRCQFHADQLQGLGEKPSVVIGSKEVDEPKYIVWNPKSNIAPMVVHGSKGEAITEAKRLAARTGQKFFVCKLQTETEEVSDEWQA